MNKKTIALVVLLSILIICLSGCSPTGGDSSNPAGFVRLSSEGYPEIFLTGVADDFKDVGWISIFRSSGDPESWGEQIGGISFSKGFDASATFVDYYCEAGKSYTYRLHGSEGNVPMVTVTASKGLGEISITPGAAVYDQDTCKLTFTKLPVFTYIPVPGITYYNCCEYIPEGGGTIYQIDMEGVTKGSSVVLNKDWFVKDTRYFSRFAVNGSVKIKDGIVNHIFKNVEAPDVPAVTFPSE